MSLYNMVFSENPISDVILATLGLTREDCGRFRDCFIANGEIAVYTRNGAGNRNCWHTDGGGNKGCRHHTEMIEEDETIEVSQAEIKNYPKQYNVWIGSNRMVGTGKRITVEHYICENPESADCACPGCVITYRLPQHVCYLRDKDDDFDCTYATIYFRFPEGFAEELKLLDSGEKFEPSNRWINVIESLKVP